MSSDTYFRILLAVVAMGMTIFLIRKLITGRSRAAGRAVDRRSEPRYYWGAVGMSAILVAALTIAVLVPFDRARFGLIFLGLLGGQLFEMLVSRTVRTPWSDLWTRANQPRPYWRWVAGHTVFVVLIAILSILQLTEVTSP